MARVMQQFFTSICDKLLEPWEENDNDLDHRASARDQSHQSPAKRDTFSTHSGHSNDRPRKRNKRAISDERDRHSPGVHDVDPCASRDTLLSNEWVNDLTMSSKNPTRKPRTGVFRPTNTLGQQTKSKPTLSPITPLDTTISTGDNVHGYARTTNVSDHRATKRQKLHQQAQAITSPELELHQADEAWFDRDTAGSPPLEQLSSPITASRAPGSGNLLPPVPLFATQESRDLNSMLTAQRKRPRKAKSTSASSSQADGTDAQPVIIPDSQELRQDTGSEALNAICVDNYPNEVTSKPVTKPHTPPRGLSRLSSLDRGSYKNNAVRVLSARDTLEANSRLSERHAARTMPSNSSPSAQRQPTTDKISTSPTLSSFFKRDGEPSSSAKPGLRKSMLSPSDTKGRAAEVEESEDELALDNPISSHTSRKADYKAVRSRSPADLKPTKFASRTHRGSPPKQAIDGCSTEESHSFTLQSLHISSVKHLDETVNLRVLPKRKSVQVEHCSSTPYLLIAKHFQSAITGPESSLRLGIRGARDDTSSGAICIEFLQRSDLNQFLQVLKKMNPKILITIKDKSGMDMVFKNLVSGIEADRGRRTFAPFDSQKAEHVDVTKRQITEHSKRAPAARERMRAAQNGQAMTTYSADEANTTRRVTAKPSSASTRSSPLADVSVDSSPRSTRMSRRLQTKDVLSTTADAHIDTPRWTQENPPLAWEAPLVYPAAGSKRTTVEETDIERLDNGEFLNDNVISFCLRFLEEQHPELKDKVHIFNTFFYTSLSTKQGKRAFNYDAVRRWTKNIDVFSYPFVVVPVNVNLHWFVTIICNLDKLGRKMGDDDEDDMIDNHIEENTAPAMGLTMELPDSQEDRRAEVVRTEVGRMSISDSMEQDTTQAIQVDGEVHEDSPASWPMPTKEALNSVKTPSRKGKRPPPRLPKLDPEQPAIITLDSLGGYHNAEVRNLKDYVVHEGQEKRGMTIQRDEIKGLVARGIPEQTNFCDCGVYLVGYITEFLKDPAEFVRKALSRELDKNNDFADFDPSEKRAEIRGRIIQLEQEQKEAKRLKKKAIRDAKLAAQTAAERSAGAMSRSTSAGNKEESPATGNVNTVSTAEQPSDGHQGAANFLAEAEEAARE